MTSITRRIDKAYYPTYGKNWDDEFFRERILAVLSAESVILDLGAGAGIVKQMNFKGLAKKVCGIDLDPRVEINPMLDEGKIANGSAIPYPDKYFDIVFADNVLEHLPEPATVFCEIKRVLKDGGVFLFKTPNKWHYMPVIARITPHWFHQMVNRLRGRAEIDTFPTRYKANSNKTIMELGQLSGMTVRKVELLEGRPEYLRIFWPLYFLGLAYERLVNRFNVLGNFRVLLIGQLIKSVDLAEDN